MNLMSANQQSHCHQCKKPFKAREPFFIYEEDEDATGRVRGLTATPYCTDCYRKGLPFIEEWQRDIREPRQTY